MPALPDMSRLSKIRRLRPLSQERFGDDVFHPTDGILGHVLVREELNELGYCVPNSDEATAALVEGDPGTNLRRRSHSQVPSGRKRPGIDISRDTTQGQPGTGNGGSALSVPLSVTKLIVIGCFAGLGISAVIAMALHDSAPLVYGWVGASLVLVALLAVLRPLSQRGPGEGHSTYHRDGRK